MTVKDYGNRIDHRSVEGYKLVKVCASLKKSRALVWANIEATLLSSIVIP
jgi:biotin operon repressor